MISCDPIYKELSHREDLGRIKLLFTMKPYEV